MFFVIVKLQPVLSSIFFPFLYNYALLFKLQCRNSGVLCQYMIQNLSNMDPEAFDLAYPVMNQLQYASFKCCVVGSCVWLVLLYVWVAVSCWHRWRFAYVSEKWIGLTTFWFAFRLKGWSSLTPFFWCIKWLDKLAIEKNQARSRHSDWRFME